MSIANYDGEPPENGLLYFTATWCGPCRMVKPELAKLKSVTVLAVDIDEHPDVAEQWNVTAVPTFLRFDGGEMVRRAVGVLRTSELRALMDAPVVTPSRLPALREPRLGTTRRATLAVRFALAEALLDGVEVMDAASDDVFAPSLLEVEGASKAAVRSFAKHLEEGGYAKLVARAAELDIAVGELVAHTRVVLTRAGKAYLKSEVAKVAALADA